MMSDPSTLPVLVTDTSPLIVLSKVGRLDLLLDASRQLLVPTAVADEIRAGPMHDPARIALDAGRFGEPIHVDPLYTVLEWGLGAGETAVMSLSITRNVLAVMDDREARRAANALGVSVVGTLGIVLEGVRQGRVESPRSLLQALRDAGLRLDEGVIAYAMSTILGDGWMLGE